MGVGCKRTGRLGIGQTGRLGKGLELSEKTVVLQLELNFPQ